MSSAKTRKKLLSIEKRRGLILSKLFEVGRMLRGSYALVYTKCGKDNCWCKDEKGHPHPRITWSEKGRAMTRKVPREHIAWIRKVTDNYRKFRSLRRKLVGLEYETKKLLDILENDMIEKTRKGKSFLEINLQNRR